MNALIAYATVAVLAAVATWALLHITKNVAAAIFTAALAASSSYLIWARLADGYWDKFWPVALTVAFVFAFVVSIAVIYIGRALCIAHFEDRDAS